VTDRPILFSAPMVQALFAGWKTQTRRVIKDDVRDPPGMDAVHPKNTIKHPAPYLDSYCGDPRTSANPRGMSDRWCWWTRDDRQCLPTFRVPFVPGDRLWVKETWCHTGTGVWSVRDSHSALDGKVIYRADDDGRDPGIKWFSSLFLPRTRSRLTLLVTDVRVERLNDISEADAQAEGVHPICDHGVGNQHLHSIAFQQLWCSLHGDGAWIVNPWVVAVSFSVHARNIDQMSAVTAEAAE
jgi:hypothetical protein